MSNQDDIFTPDGFVRHMDRLALENTGAVSRQHVVSRVVLKRFATKNNNNGHELIAFNLEYAKQQRRGIGECGKIADLIEVASGSAEKLWQAVENELPPVLEAIDSGAVVSENQTKIAKSAVALHFVRSPYWRQVPGSYRQGLQELRDRSQASLHRRWYVPWVRGRRQGAHKHSPGTVAEVATRMEEYFAVMR